MSRCCDIQSSESIWIDKIISYGLMAVAFFIVWRGFHNLVEYSFFGLLAIWLVHKVGERDFKFKTTSIDWTIGGYLLWILITIPNSIDIQYSFSEWLKTFAHVLLFYFVVNVIHTESQVRHVLNAALAGMLVLSLIGIVQFVAQNEELLSKDFRAASLTNSSQWFSTYLVMGLPIVWLGISEAHGKAFIYLYAFVLCCLLLALFLAHTRSAYISVGFQLLVFCGIYFFRKGVQVAGIAILSIICLICSLMVLQQQEELIPNNSLTDMSSMHRRFGTWTAAMNDVRENPFVGIGYGKNSFSFHHVDFGERFEHDSIHNFFLSKAVQVGLPGLFFLIMIFGQVLNISYSVWRRYESKFVGRLGMVIILMVSGLLVRNMFDDMLVGTLSYFFWFLLGLFFALLMRIRNCEDNSVIEESGSGAISAKMKNMNTSSGNNFLIS